MCLSSKWAARPGSGSWIACRAAAAPGGPSTHGLGVPDAIRLAVALDHAPRRLVVLAVEAADLGFGIGLSSPVTACLPELTRMVLAEVAAGRGS